MSVPFMSISNEELSQKKDVSTVVTCKNCGRKHKVEYGTSKTLKDEGTYTEPVKSNMLGFVKCGEETFLVSIAGKEI